MRRFPPDRSHCAIVLAGLSLLVSLTARPAHADPKDYFGITVVDAATGRGVPLVELRTTNDETFYTDSNGVVALNEPDLMNHKVWFGIKSHGYQYPADGFGYRGKALDIKAGGRVTLKIARVNIAERLYRITGAGIYRDSVLLGLPVPIKNPLMSGLVVGQDTVEVMPYRGKLYWFFGDTSWPAYPLGQFATSGATSPLPDKGGTDPDVGIDLTYWTDDRGFSRKMIPFPNPRGPVWVGALFTLADETGRERLLTRYVEVSNKTGEAAEYGMALWNDETEIFEKKTVYATGAPLIPDGHIFTVSEAGRKWLRFEPNNAFPMMRIPADWKSVFDPKTYESFTCLAPGAHWDGEKTRLDRDASGHLVYGWKRDTALLNFDQQAELIKKGKLAAAEAPFQLRDVETDTPIHPHGGSTYWNPYRKRWIALFSEAFAKPSFLGELWYAEADTPTGPWTYARKVLTHDRYTFYNPTQHPFFNRDSGKTIYFEGTYTDTYSGNPEKTPRYNYNQIMYRLSLDDSRLTLPEPVYRLTGKSASANSDDYGMRESLATPEAGDWSSKVRDIAFYAVPASRRHEGLIPLYATPQPSGAIALQTTPTSSNTAPLGYVLPGEVSASEKLSPAIVPLYEYIDSATGRRWYTPADSAPSLPTTAKRSEKPICRVWRSPATTLPLDAGAQAVE